MTHPLGKKLVETLRGNVVLYVAAFAALVSMVAVPPSDAYLDYMNWRVLGLLFCLMVCVRGLTDAGIFARTGQILLAHCPSVRSATALLVCLCFFTSMLVTNDVALITFVPFTLYAFTLADRRESIGVAVVLQTVAANLGSMVTPMGNPQNLFLYTAYDLGFGDIAGCVGPFACVSFLLLMGCCMALLPKGPLANPGVGPNGPARKRAQKAAVADQRLAADQQTADQLPAVGQRLAADQQAADQRPAAALDARRAVVFGVLFVLATLAVSGVVPLPIAFAVILGVAFVANRAALAEVDYGLLLTFVCFFVFSGNLSHVSLVRDALTGLMGSAPFATSLLASQFISNVPAATLLAPFTSQWSGLMLGVDLGGLGTPVASLASLISLEYYRRARVGKTSSYLGIFLLVNVGFLLANILVGVALGAW